MKYIVEYETFRQMNSESINEGFTQGIVTDVIQFLISGAAEYGISIPSYGGGTPAGVVAETAIDAVFAGSTIGTAVNLINNMKGQFSEFTDIVNKSLEAYQTFRDGKFKSYYEQVRDIIVQGLSMIKGAKEGVDKLAKRLRKLVSDLLAKITDAVGKGIKMLIPDATIGASVSAGIKVVVQTASQNGYSVATKALEKAGKLKDYLLDPEKLPPVVEKAIAWLLELMENWKNKIKKMGWLKATALFAAGGLTAGAAIKSLGPTGLQKMSEMIKKSEPKILDLISKTLKVIVPVAFTLLALYQILMKGDYKKQKEESKEDNEDKNVNSDKESDKESKKEGDKKEFRSQDKEEKREKFTQEQDE